MTSVNITTDKNTVTVNGDTNVVTVATQGPQGPSFSNTDTVLIQLVVHLRQIKLALSKT